MTNITYVIKISFAKRKPVLLCDERGRVYMDAARLRINEKCKQLNDLQVTYFPESGVKYEVVEAFIE